MLPRPTLTIAARAVIATAALAAVLAAGCDDEEPPIVSVPFDEGSGGITVVAKGTSYSLERIEVEAGGTTTITLDNQDSVAHTLAVFLGASAEGEVAADTGEVGAGERGEAVVFFSSAGEHAFRCAIHPDQMTGTLIVR